MKLHWGTLSGDLRALNHRDLAKLAAHVNAEMHARAREQEHFAHLGRTSDDPNCQICRDAAKQRSANASD